MSKNNVVPDLRKLSSEWEGPVRNNFRPQRRVCHMCFAEVLDFNLKSIGNQGFLAEKKTLAMNFRKTPDVKMRKM